MKRRNEVLVGLLLTAALLIGVGGTVWLVRGGFRSGYALYSVFRWGDNLKVGQPVRLAGVQVGYVADVDLVPNGTLLVKMEVDKGTRVPRNARAVVEAVGLFGDAQLSLLATPDTRSYAANDTVPVGPSAAGIPQITAKGDTVATQVAAIAAAARRELVDSGGLRDVRQTLAQTNALVARLAAVAAEQNRQLTQTQVALRRTLAGVDPAKVDSTLTSVRAASANAAALTDSLKRTTAQLNATLGGLGRGEGSAGKLLRDTLLYSDVRRLIGRVDTLTLDFQRNPGKYTRGIVRIF